MHTVPQNNELRCDYVTLLYVQVSFFCFVLFSPAAWYKGLEKGFYWNQGYLRSYNIGEPYILYECFKLEVTKLIQTKAQGNFVLSLMKKSIYFGTFPEHPPVISGTGLCWLQLSPSLYTNPFNGERLEFAKNVDAASSKTALSHIRLNCSNTIYYSTEYSLFKITKALKAVSCPSHLFRRDQDMVWILKHQHVKHKDIFVAPSAIISTALRIPYKTAVHTRSRGDLITSS